MGKDAARSTQPKQFEDQFDDEEVLYLFRKHPVVMRKGLILAAFGLLVGPLYTLALIYMRPLQVPSTNFFFASLAASVVLSAVLFFPAWMNWYYSVYIVTNQRFIQINQKGLFKRSVVDIGLNHIRSVNYEVIGVQETLLGFGTITIQTYFGDLVIHEVHHPGKITKKLSEIMREQGVMAVPDGMDVDNANKQMVEDYEG